MFWVNVGLIIIDMNLNFDKVLITGITGLLGSWLAEKLINEGIEVTGIAIDDGKDFLLDSKKLLSYIDIEKFNIADKDLVEKYYQKNEFDVVIHLAAQTQVRDALDNPIETFESNIKGTWNLLEASRKYNVPIVVASSDKAYGVSKVLPYEESFPLKGEYPYEFSKTATDMLCTTYKTTYDLPVSVLRCGNIYGGGDLNWDRLIPGVSRWLIKNEQPKLRTAGQFKRDWVYVEDVVDAYIKLTDALISKNKNVSIAYNFSSKDYLSVMDIYSKVCKIVKGEYIEPIIEENSNFEIEDQYLSSNKISEELNIVAKFSIDEGLVKTIDWYKENISLMNGD